MRLLPGMPLRARPTAQIELKMGTLIDIKVKLDFAVLREYLLGRDGLWRDMLSLLGAVFLCVAASGLQLALPSALPELPIYPAVLVSCCLYGGRLSWLWPVLCGVLLDCWTYGMMGVSSLFLSLCVLLHFLILRSMSRRWPEAVSAGVASFAATFCWTLLMLLFKAEGMPVVQRLALMPRQVFLASLLAVPLGSLLHFKKGSH